MRKEKGHHSFPVDSKGNIDFDSIYLNKIKAKHNRIYEFKKITIIRFFILLIIILLPFQSLSKSNGYILLEHPINNGIIILFILSILLFIISIRFYLKSKKIIQSKKNELNNTKKINHNYKKLNSQFLINNNYIQPYVLQNGSSSKQLLHDFFINKVFIKESKEPNDVYIIFGDTGTGKTTALVHLFNDYVTQYKPGKHPYPHIKFFSLRDTTLETISSLPDKENTILLLDALNETPAAQDPIQFLQFQKDLQAIFHNFARVVITCRPQLFSNQEAASAATHTKIRTSTGWVQCTELFLVPFDDQQVQAYLDQVFTFRSDNPDRKKAEEIVNKHAYIAIRPLVLTYIKDIVESKRDINTALDLYDIIIEKTLQRDLEKINPNPSEEQIQQWWDITSDVAGYMYRHNKLSITEQELDSIPSITKEPQFKQHSMLTRTDNEFHFPHKSFYEYFMAYRFILYPEEITKGTLYSMDFALQRYEELYKAYKEKHPVRFANLESMSVRDFAGSLNNIGMRLYDLNHFSEAEPKYQAALNLFRQLEEQNPSQFIDDVATTLNNLANLHSDINNYPAAEKEYTEALKKYRDLANKNHNVFLPKVTMTLNNLAILHNDTHNYYAAEKEYTEALNTYRQMEEKDPEAFLPYIAATLNNLAALHSDIHNHPAAEEEYAEALNIRRDLAEKNPDVFLPDVAMTLNNLAALHYNTQNYPAAEAEYTEALKIRRDLAEKNLDAFLPNVATTLNNLAVLHRKTNNYPAAEEEYTEALNIRRDLAEKNPDAFLPDVAMTLYNMALLYLSREEHDIPAAEAAAQESLEKYKIMAEKSHAAFDPDVKDAEELLAKIQRLKQQK